MIEPGDVNDANFDLQLNDTTSPPAEPLPEVESVADIVVQSVNEQQNVTPIGTGYAGDTEGNLALAPDPDWSAPIVEPLPGDGSPEAEHVREMLTDGTQAPTFEEAFGVDPETYYDMMAREAPYINADIFLHSPAFHEAVGSGIRGPVALRQYLRIVNAEEKRNQEIAEMQDEIAAGRSAPPDPVETMLDAKLGPVLQWVEQQQYQEALRQDADVRADEILGAYRTAAAGKIDFIPLQSVVAAINELGLHEPAARQMPPERVLAIATAHVRSQSPQLSAPRQVGERIISGTGPRAIITIPQGPSATPTVTPRDRIRQLAGGDDPFDSE